MTSNNEIEAAIILRAQDEASDELDNVGKSAGGVERQLGGMAKGFIVTSLAAFAASISMGQVASASQAAQSQAAKTAGTLALMGINTQESFTEISGAFEGISDDLGTTRANVEEAARIITLNSGGIVPSIDQIWGAFDIAAASGASFEEAAVAIGQALQGNEEPLNRLLDPSGRSYISLNEAIKDTKGSFKESQTGMSEFFAAFGDFMERAGLGMEESLGPAFEWLAERLGWFTDDSEKRIADFLASLKELHDNSEEFLRPFIEAGVIPDVNFGGLQPVEPLPPGSLPEGFEDGFWGESGPTPTAQPINITINGDVDSAERTAELGRQIREILAQERRRGIAVD